ncbi:putative toxin-antitoxin system toxin component, PIN family [Candidatus Micrarchaeota archaeon]|nr:putative toxin-antitoxin system toxin component, PIN family [Candidatus Micrarchaeota archaeon]
MNVVLDTNVLISGTFWEGEAYQIMQLIEQKRIGCFLSKDILEEYNKVMHSEEIIEKIEEKHLAIKSVIIKLLESCEIVDPKRKIDFVKDDPDDNKVLECAIEAKADYIITYDAAHLLKLREFEGIKIISPTEFLRILSVLKEDRSSQ